MSFSSGEHGPNDFSTLGDAARIEAVKKGSAYMNVWMYAIREFEDAIDDCSTCDIGCNEFSLNDGAVHAWDEGVAFYSGTLEGTAEGGDGAGKLVYRLAEKRCQNFGTCGADGDQTSGTSQVNLALFPLFAEGARLLRRGECGAVRPLVEQIVSLMTVPLVQGSLRYAYKIGEVPADRSQKNAAEGATFSAAVLPLVHHCSPVAASTISEHLKFGLYDAGTFPDFSEVKEAFESAYPCLGITCAHVGALPGTSACTLEPIAGYIPGSDVTEHNKIDLDQAAMEAALKAGDWGTAAHWYAVGGNSLSKGSFRTMKGFSTSAQAKMYDGCPGCPYKHYKMFYDYYGSHTYADDWVSAALDATDLTFPSGKHGPNAFSALGAAARIEAVKKGTAYMNVWMYTVREFEDAIDDCTSCTSNCNEHSTNSDSVHAWDEGVAFYTGSLEGTAYGGNSNGKLLYRLAEKRCANFGTCLESGTGATGTSQVNSELFQLFDHGRDWLQQGRCSSVRPLVNQIVSLMTVPLVQGALRYAYKNSPAGADMASAKNAAEGATFSAAVLPLVHDCNAASAAVVTDNLKFGLFPTGGDAVTARYSDFAAVKAAFEDVYACLGITCAQVGGLIQAIDANVAAAAACTHQSAVIAGYMPGSDVTQHNKIDLDQKDIETALAASPADFSLAKTRYTDGGNSKTASPYRTLQGFSTSAQAKMYDGCPGCPYKHYKMFYDYYGSHTYAHDWVFAALDATDLTFPSGKHGPNAFSTLGEAARIEAVKKGTAYMNVWMYVIREFEDAT